MIIGAHVSIAGGVEKAVLNAAQLGCETFQIFTKNQNQWKEKTFTESEIAGFRDHLERYPLHANLLASHDSYLINLCSPEKELLEKSVAALLQEARRCLALGIPFLIFHPGSHVGKGEEWGLKTIAKSLNRVIEKLESDRIRFLLETTAGQGSNLGYRFEQLVQILENVKYPEFMGVCADTCHLFAAGYDIRREEDYQQTIRAMESLFGIEKIMAFHLNDSKNDLGSRVDRHETIGEGNIGLSAFRLLMQDPRFETTPGFLEIPGGDDAFKKDIRMLKKLRGEKTH
jgi:deoxyribonuclease-4